MVSNIFYIREVQVHTTRNRRRHSLSLNHSFHHATDVPTSKIRLGNFNLILKLFAIFKASIRYICIVHLSTSQRNKSVDILCFVRWLRWRITVTAESNETVINGYSYRIKRRFVYLSPTESVEKAELHNLSLRCKQLALFEYGSSWEFYELASAGGYELMQTKV